MLSEVAGNKMIPFGTSFTTTNTASSGGATSLSQAQANYRRIEPMPIKNGAQSGNKTSTTTKAMDNNMPPPRNPNPESNSTSAPPVRATKVKVQDLNEFFVCFLCEGYKIEATTINECMHSFCRSCIVKHLEVKHYCPECFHKKYVVNADGNGNMLRIGIVNSNGSGQQSTVQTPRIITSQNLFLDTALCALIYKSVPGLYHREMASVQRFYANKSDDLKPIGFESHKCSSFERIIFGSAISRDNKVDQVADPVFVSAEEPISLSLEYHPRELQGMTKINPENMPKVQYLQCPAGVRIRHLEKFLCSKFSISPQDHSIDLIYEDKVLAKDLNLMDVVYCFSWKRDAPMRFLYRIFFTGQAEPPRMRVKMVVKDNDDLKKPEPAVAKHKSESKTLPPITMRIKHDLQPNGAAAEKRYENKIKLSNIIGSSTEARHSDNNNVRGSPRRGDGSSGNRQQINAANPTTSSIDKKSSDAKCRAGEKRKLKDEFEFVDEVTISNSPKGAKSPPSSSIRSPQRQHSPKSVTFNETVQATRIPFIKYVNPATTSPPPNDFKRLRSSGDIVNSSALSSPPKVTGSSSSSTSANTTTTTSTSTSTWAKNTSSDATNDSSRITSGTVPDNNSKQFPSKQQQQLQQPSTQLHTSSSAASAQQISKHTTKSNTQQLHNNHNKSEKFPTSLSAKNDPAIGNNRHQNSSNSSPSKKKSGDSADDPWSIRNKQQQTPSADPTKNDFNGNLRHEKNHNVATMLANTDKSTAAVENRNEAERRREREEDKYEYAKNIGLKPIHEVIRGAPTTTTAGDKNKDVDAAAAAKRKASTTGSVDDPSSMLYHKKKKKSKHSKDFPFADVKKKKVDYDLAISSSNVPKSLTVTKEANGSSRPEPAHHPDSLKMKFVKVTTADKNNAKVMVIPKGSDKEAPNGRTMSSGTNQSPPLPKISTPMPALTTTTSGNKSPKPGQSSKVPKLGNFIVKDNSMEIHQIPKATQGVATIPPKKSPSPPSLTITSTSTSNRNIGQPIPKPSAPAPTPPPPVKRAQSFSTGSAPPAPKRPNMPMQSPRSVDPPAYKDVGSASPYLQRSYSYDPSAMMAYNYNLSLMPFQMHLANEMQKQWAAAAAAAVNAKQQAGSPVGQSPVPMVPFFNANIPQSRSPPVHPGMSAQTHSSSKKPVPPLVPPSSLVGAPFGKYNPVPNLVATSSAKPPTNMNNNRLKEKPPMVEIVRLPPGLDKVEIPHIPAKAPPKANRPPPPTIPLVKIRRASANSTSSTESGDGMTGSSRPREVPAVLDLSGRSGASVGKGTGEKVSTSSQKPLPQLNEISKISRGGALIHRQQSASVRSVPNPSALALRNQMPQSAVVKGPTAAAHETSQQQQQQQRTGMSPNRVSPPAMASFTSKSSNLEKLASKIKEGVSTNNNSMAK